MQSHAAQEVTKTVWTPLPCYQSWRRVGPEAIGDVLTIGDVFVLFSGSKLLLTCLLVLLGEWKLVPRWTDLVLFSAHMFIIPPLSSPHTPGSPPLPSHHLHPPPPHHPGPLVQWGVQPGRGVVFTSGGDPPSFSGVHACPAVQEGREGGGSEVHVGPVSGLLLQILGCY